jgi:hypothetical protein
MSPPIMSARLPLIVVLVSVADRLRQSAVPAGADIHRDGVGLRGAHAERQLLA